MGRRRHRGRGRDAGPADLDGRPARGQLLAAQPAPRSLDRDDLVLVVTELLRRHGVVGKSVEFYGPSVSHMPVEDRATIGGMSPEYGSTITIFPIDDQTLRCLRLTGQPDRRVARVEAYAKEQVLWFDPPRHRLFSETSSRPRDG